MVITGRMDLQQAYFSPGGPLLSMQVAHTKNGRAIQTRSRTVTNAFLMMQNMSQILLCTDISIVSHLSSVSFKPFFPPNPNASDGIC